jgi:hypothetical protein
MGASWSRSLGDGSATLNITCKNLNNNHVMGTVTLYVDGVLYFTGIVKSQTEDMNDRLRISNLNCVDRTDWLQRRIVAESFTDRTPKQILTSLRNKYATWLDVSEVRNVFGAIEEIAFPYETFASVIEKLAEITGAYWYIDEANKLQFFLNDRGLSSVQFQNDGIIQNSFNIESSAIELCNRVWVIGARHSSPVTIEQTFFGDNSNQYFLLAYEPNYPALFENGVPKTIEEDNGDESDKDYVYSKKIKVLKRNAGPLPIGTNLRITYRPTVQIIDYFEDTDSVTQNGLFEKVIRDGSINAKSAARSRGRAELKLKKDIIVTASWSTRKWQLYPGEIVEVAIADFALNRFFRIDSVDVDFSPEDIVASVNATEVEQ